MDIDITSQTPIHHTLFLSQENDFSKLYSTIQIIIKNIPPNAKLYQDYWRHIIKEVQLDISLASPQTRHFYNFDRIFYTSVQRDIEALFYDHKPIAQTPYTVTFDILPHSFLKRSLSYLYGMKNNCDYIYKLDTKIVFNDINKLMISQNSVENTDFEIEANIYEIPEYHPVFKEHQDFWDKGRSDFFDLINEKDINILIDKILYRK